MQVRKAKTLLRYSPHFFVPLQKPLKTLDFEFSLRVATYEEQGEFARNLGSKIRTRKNRSLQFSLNARLALQAAFFNLNGS